MFKRAEDSDVEVSSDWNDSKWGKDDQSKVEETQLWDEKVKIPKYIKNKITLWWYSTSINVIHAWDDR